MESHGFDKVINSTSKILILGSFPSVKSRQDGFYYMHKLNRFWKVLTYIFSDERFLSSSIDMKKEALNSHHIALFDVITECEIKLSADETIKPIKIFSLEEILKIAPIELILCNGKKSYELFLKYYKDCPITYKYVPSTSARNASYSLDKLCQIYKQTIDAHFKLLK